MPSPTVTLNEVKKNIRALLLSAPRGLTVDDIEHDYRAMLGKPIPFKNFKCNTALEFLKTMPDVVCPTWTNGTLILRGIADSSTRHIAKLVSRQKTNASKSRRISKPQICTKPLIVPSHFRENMKELLSSYPHGILGSALNNAYRRNYGEEINFVKLGFKSMSHLLGSIQDIALIVKDDRGGFRVCAVKSKPKQANRNIPLRPSVNSSQSGGSRSSKNAVTSLTSLEGNTTMYSKNNEKHIENCVKSFLDSKSAVSDSLKEELISILTKRPNGLWAARLPFEYQSMFGKQLSVISLGFYSVIELVSSLPDVIRVERPIANGDWMLFLTEKSKRDKGITKTHICDDAVGKGVSFPPQTLPEADTIGVYVTHVKTPDSFWVQIADSGPDIRDLEEKMDKFYNSKESVLFLMDESLIKLGQVCVAKFPVNNSWYRALVSGTPLPHLVEVFYVDYGNCCQVFKSDLRLMKKQFLQLHPQAIKSKLANIKPQKKDKWEPDAAYRLNELTEDKELFCWVTGKKDEVLSLCICDTTSEVDVHINDTLVDEGYAVYACKTPVEEKSFQAFNQQVNNNNNCSSDTQPLHNGIASKGNVPISLSYPINHTLPDYSMNINAFPNFLSSYGVSCQGEQPAKMNLQPEQKPSVLLEEEKPSVEDVEFMRQVCEELTDVEEQTDVIVKRLDLPDEQFVHLINYEGKPHVVSSEISALLWDSDLLRKMLRREKLVILKEVIAREDNENLFKELERLEIADFDDEEKPKEYASLYELSTLPKILETFKHSSERTVMKLKEEADAFETNPDSFWATNSDEDEASVEEMRLALQLLQLRRKRILRSMMKGDVLPGENAVDEVDSVEKQMEHIRTLLLKAEAKEAKCEEAKPKVVETAKQAKNTELKEEKSAAEHKESVLSSTCDEKVVEDAIDTTIKEVSTKIVSSPTPLPEKNPGIVKEARQRVTMADLAKRLDDIPIFDSAIVSCGKQNSATPKNKVLANQTPYNPQHIPNVTRPTLPIPALLAFQQFSQMPPASFMLPLNNPQPVAQLPTYLNPPNVLPEFPAPPYNFSGCPPFDFVNQAPIPSSMFPWNQNMLGPSLFSADHPWQGR